MVPFPGRSLARALCATLATCTAACSLLDPHNLVGRQMGEAKLPPAEVVPPLGEQAMDVAARERAFAFVWSTIRDRYYDAALNGADWTAIGHRYRDVALTARDDEALWDVLDRMAGELHDSHTRVESPARVELRRRDESITLGFAFVAREGKLAITVVNPESDAWWAGVRPGMAIVSIAGEPAAAAYERLKADTRHDSTERSRHARAVRRLVTGKLGSTLAFTFERPDATRFDTVLSRCNVTTRPTAFNRVLPSGFGYLRLTQWQLAVMPRALSGLAELKDTPGLVIDLRGNPGGSMYAVNQMLDRFFTERVELGRSITRTGKPVSLLFGVIEIIKLKAVVEGNKDAYSKPVVILVNAGSASGSELFAGAMQAAGRAQVVGEPSCGCLLAFLGYARIPGGGELAYSEVGFVMGKDRKSVV